MCALRKGVEQRALRLSLELAIPPCSSSSAAPSEGLHLARHVLLRPAAQLQPRCAAAEYAAAAAAGPSAQALNAAAF